MVGQLDARRLASGAVLSAVAGWVDAVAFIILGGYFVSFMSGNTTRGAVDIASAGPWWTAVVLVASFVAGVVVASIAQRLAGARAGAAALAIVAALIAVATVGAGHLPLLVVAACLAAGMGAVNVAFARNQAVSVGITYMTGALVKAAQGAVGAAWGERGTGWWRYLVLWGAIAVGAIGGAFGYAALGLGALWVALAVVLGLLALSLATER